MYRLFNRLAVGAVALVTALSVFGVAFAAGIPSGVGGNPTMGPFPVTDSATGPMVMVMSDTGGPIPIYIDPNAERWVKKIHIGPNSLPAPPVLQPGMIIPIWEKILIQPAPDGTIRLPFTDWHEHIHPVEIPGLPPLPFGWAGGELVIHNPAGPDQLPPLVRAPGMVDPLDPSSIWFGPWPGIVPPAGANGLPVWIHKQLRYLGTQPFTAFPPNGITIEIWEWPTVPEPTSFALAGVGGLATLLLRRRKY